MNTVELKNISISYPDNWVIKELSFKLNKGELISILTSSGKSTICKLFNKEIDYKGQFRINGVEINKTNDYLVNRFIHVIDNNRTKSTKKVIDILFDTLEEFKYAEDEEKEIINEVIDFFNIDFLNKRLNDLDDSKYYYFKIITTIMKMYDFLVFDNILCYLSNNNIDKVFEYIEKKKIGLINLTNNIDELLYCNYAIFMYDGRISMEGDVLSCLREEKLLKRLGYSLPFIYDLSLQLSYYNVIKGPLLDEEKLVNEIWN